MMSLKLKLGFFIGLLFVTAIGNAIFTFVLEGYSDEKLKWVSHTNEVILEKEHYLGALKDTETGQRGYLLTQDINYLEPYHRGLILAEDSFNQLVFLTSDNHEQQERLVIIKASMALKFAELKETIDLAQSGEVGYTKALDLVKEDKGKKFMDDIRRELGEFTNAEFILLEIRKGDFREQKAALTTLIAVEIVFFVFLAFVTILFLSRNLFEPLAILLKGTKSTQKGERISIDDVLAKGEMGYLISSLFKMNEIVHARTEDLSYKAHFDNLTGLKNRSTLFESIENSIKTAQKSQTKLALLFLDLNKFKPLNDTLGHDAGDIVLQETAKRLKSSVRSNDLVFRIGGDEFLVLLHDFKNTQEVQSSVEKILRAFEAKLSIQDQNITISTSIGVTIAPDNSTSAQELVKQADVAMYKAKESSQSFVVFTKDLLKRSSD